MKTLFWSVCLSLAIASCNSSKNEKQNQMVYQKTTVAWAHNTNIYEVNLRQYTREGSFNAFAKELPRLKDMGVETIWFMPITPIAQKNKKGTLGSYYACSDYTAINPEFGTMDDFKAVVKQAHSLGIKVIIDWVANHTGWDHVWTKTNPEYYLKDSTTNDFQIASGMDDIIELDFSNPQLVAAMIDAMKFWVKEANIDGFRCDLASWVELPFWVEARKELDKEKNLFWLGEYDELENPDYAQVFDASYSWKWMHKSREYYEGKASFADLDSLLQHYNAIGDGSMRAWFTSNHDENSWNGTEYEKYGEMAKALAVFSATWNGVPLLYSGQELPLEKKRLEFFEKDPIPWTGEYKLHDFYKKLLTLKTNNTALRGGDTAVTTYRLENATPNKVLAYLRKKDKDEVLVILNFSNENFDALAFNEAALTGTFRDIFTDASFDFTAQNKIQLAPWSYYVFVK